MSSQPYDIRNRAGVRVRVSYEGVISKDQKATTEGKSIVIEREGIGGWYEALDTVQLEILPLDLVPGMIVSAGGVDWCVRKSNNHEPNGGLHVMPVDLSKKLRTLDIALFSSRYPRAKVRFDPRPTPLEEWEAELLASNRNNGNS